MSEEPVKAAIHEGAAARRERGDGDPGLAYATVEASLKKKLRHDMASLLELLNEHLDALGGEKLSDRTQLVLGLVSETDPSGNGFRFPGQLPNVHVSVDFTRLAADLDSAYVELAGATDYLDALCDMERDRRAEQESWM
ncbi:hypothetical protein [Agromyces archimandritae]|uniref:Uncharacterized protein n=1 Tax=Agromyces archimandritae TaxID=2781962 RepID=A0A975INL5_9MICO|nr:hypothetical protein [Agromyces archimandritae]QTX04369.1 hypothetical protein G127AT_14010 [Agromyces archimandritae]